MYKVRPYMDDEYAVYDEGVDIYLALFRGSLADCEAWIRLTESGRL